MSEVVKKKQGRPKGSKNKSTIEKEKLEAKKTTTKVSSEKTTKKEVEKAVKKVVMKELKEKLEYTTEVTMEAITEVSPSIEEVSETIIENTVKIVAPTETDAINKAATRPRKEQEKKTYREDRPTVHIGVVSGMKALPYMSLQGHLETAVWGYPPWEYKRKMYVVNMGPNYNGVHRYAAARNIPLQTCPVYWTKSKTPKMDAFAHLVKMIKGGYLLILKEKNKEDGAINRLIHMAKMHNITISIKEY